MIPYTRNMTQDATYWAPVSNDGFGGKTFAAPILIKCRWQDKAELFRDTQGREVVSKSIVYPNQQLAIRGYLALGDQSATADPRQVPGASEIRQFDRSHNLAGTLVLNKAYL